MKKPKIIEARIEIKRGKYGEFRLIYIPDQTQILEAGEKYEFVFKEKENVQNKK